MIKLKDILPEAYNAAYMNILIATKSVLKKYPEAEPEAQQYITSIGKPADTPLDQLDMEEITGLNIAIWKYLAQQNNKPDPDLDDKAKEAAAAKVADLSNHYIAKYYADKPPGGFTGD